MKINTGYSPHAAPCRKLEARPVALKKVGQMPVIIPRYMSFKTSRREVQQNSDRLFRVHPDLSMAHETR
jgi:hypothetical protein